MKVVFRVDASDQMGIGHLMRCLTLAESLRGRGARISFVCREHRGNLIELLRQEDMPVKVLPAPTAVNATFGEDHAAWLGTSQADDAEHTIEALNGEKPDWLVVDHYGLHVEWEQRLQPQVDKLMVIDDLANRRHDCDVLLDQNYFADGELRYAGLVPDACKLLLGPRYALLRPEYVAYRKPLRARDGQLRRVLVFFGGTDPQNVTTRALEALSHHELEHLEVDVVVGTNNPNRKHIEQQVLRRPRTTLHHPRQHLADLMAQADLGLGAGGATTWERMCSGLPTLVVSIAENQRPVAEALAAQQLILYLGHESEVSTEAFSSVIAGLVSNIDRLNYLREQNQLMVDGLGAIRIREVMLPTDIAKIQLRAAREEDVNIYFDWANDSEVRRNSNHPSRISWSTHKEWFAKKLNDSNSYLYVLNAACLPVGQIRFDKEGNEARIDYSLDALARGRGWGARLVSLGSEMLQENEPIGLLAEVKVNNEVSRSVFLRLGFTMIKGKNNNFIFRRNPEKSIELLK